MNYDPKINKLAYLIIGGYYGNGVVRCLKLGMEVVRGHYTTKQIAAARAVVNERKWDEIRQRYHESQPTNA